MLHVLLWWLPCEMRHEWYGTSSALWHTMPTALLSQR
jgi:hypothetical protein